MDAQAGSLDEVDGKTPRPSEGEQQPRRVQTSAPRQDSEGLGKERGRQDEIE